MSNKTIKISGPTSTFIPGGTGTGGTRASVTFFSTEGNNPSRYFKAKYNNVIIKVVNQYNDIDKPLVNDYIIYSAKNVTYILFVTGEFDSTDNTYLTEIKSTWDTQSSSGSGSIDISSIDLNVTCDVDHNFIYNGFKNNICSILPLKLNEYDYQCSVNTSDLDGYSASCFKFGITSNNMLPLGIYRIVVEFNTGLQSPGMDTRIADKFIDPSQYPDHHQSDQISISEKMTFKGYISNYSCVGCTKNALDEYENPTNVTINNFDDEKLDNFEIIVKDYSDGIGQMSFESVIYVPKSVLINAYNAGFSYKCNMYIYINGSNNSIEKVWMQDISELVDNEVINNPENPHFENVSTNNTVTDTHDDLIIDDPIIDNNSTNNSGNDNLPDIDTEQGYDGTKHSGTYKIYLSSTAGSSISDQLYVDDIAYQNLTGSLDWCKCEREGNYLKYTAITKNPSTEQRIATFRHKTTSQTLSRGENAGKKANSIWYVTVVQYGRKTPGHQFQEDEILPVDEQED